MYCDQTQPVAITGMFIFRHNFQETLLPDRKHELHLLEQYDLALYYTDIINQR